LQRFCRPILYQRRQVSQVETESPKLNPKQHRIHAPPYSITLSRSPSLREHIARCLVYGSLSKNPIWLRAACFATGCPDVHRELHRRYTAISPASPSFPVTKPLALGPTTGFFDRLLAASLVHILLVFVERHGIIRGKILLCLLATKECEVADHRNEDRIETEMFADSL